MNVGCMMLLTWIGKLQTVHDINKISQTYVENFPGFTFKREKAHFCIPEASAYLLRHISPEHKLNMT